MSYPTLANVNATTDLSNLLIYSNDVTNGAAMPVVLLGFFIVAFIASMFAQTRFRGTTRIDFSFAAASFVTFGMAVIMSLKDGLLNTGYLLLSLAMAILAALWLYLSNQE